MRGNVLLVDDEAPVLRAHARVLRQQGFSVDTLEDGRQAAARVQRGDIDVVVTDLTMPHLDGIGVLRTIRSILPDLPVVILTGGADLSSALQAVEHGALRYLQKPVPSELLAETLDRGVHVGRVAREKREAYEQANRRALDELELETRFAAAYAGLRMAFQPIVRASDQAVYGAEALVRTSEPSLRRPDHLFGAAETLGRVHDLGRRIRQLVAARLAAADAPPHMFVNLHPLDLQDPDLYDRAAPLSAFAGKVVLEVTERASLGEMEGIQERVRDLRALGYRVALDDLGAGYAGLDTLVSLRPDLVKLDRALIERVDRDLVKETLVGSMIHVARELAMDIIAEGVETPGERDALFRLGCPLLQGYLFGRPV